MWDVRGGTCVQEGCEDMNLSGRMQTHTSELSVGAHTWGQGERKRMPHTDSTWRHCGLLLLIPLVRTEVCWLGAGAES